MSKSEWNVPDLVGTPWSDRTCPAPHQIPLNFAGKSFVVSMDFTWTCSVLSFLRPIVLAGGAAAAIAIFISALRKD